MAIILGSVSTISAMMNLLERHGAKSIFLSVLLALANRMNNTQNI